MSIPAGGLLAPPGGVGSPAAPEADVGTMYATWIDPLGEEIQLSNTEHESDWFTTDRISGWGATKYEIVTDPIPRGGVSIRYIRAQPARIIWPLYIGGDTYVEFLARYHHVRAAFMRTMHLGQPGILRVALPDGSGREVECFCEEGFEGEPGEMHTFARPVLTLFVPDGFWRDVEPTVINRSYSVGGDFLAPYPQVSSSQILGVTDVDNPGDAVAWPFWTITGPMTALVATNTLTGQAFTLTTNLLAGEQATINTKLPLLRGPAGQNLTGALNWPNAALWPLLPGNNPVNFVVSGAGAGTAIQLAFRARYEGI